MKNSRTHTAVFLNFMSDVVKGFGTRLQEFAEIRVSCLNSLNRLIKLFQLQNKTYVTTESFSLEKLLLQMEIKDLQDDIFLQMYVSASPEEFSCKQISEKHKI